MRQSNGSSPKMADDNKPVFTLYFESDSQNADDIPQLVATRFSAPQLSTLKVCTRESDSGNRPGATGSFKYTRGVKALCRLAILDKANALRAGTQRFEIQGSSRSLAACLVEGLRQAKKAKQSEKNWLKDMFGEKKNGEPRAADLLLATNTGKKRAGDVGATFSSMLKPENIQIAVGDRFNSYSVTDPDELERLASAVESDDGNELAKKPSWRGPLPWKGSAAHFNCGVFGVALDYDENNELLVFCQERGDGAWWAEQLGVDPDTGPMFVDLPGGGVEITDTSLECALRREVAEETQGCRIEIVDPDPVGPFVLINGTKRDIAFGYRIELKGTPKPTNEALSHHWIRWRDLEEESVYRLPGKGKESRLADIIRAMIRRMEVPLGKERDADRTLSQAIGATMNKKLGGSPNKNRGTAMLVRSTKRKTQRSEASNTARPQRKRNKPR